VSGYGSKMYSERRFITSKRYLAGAAGIKRGEVKGKDLKTSSFI